MQVLYCVVAGRLSRDQGALAGWVTTPLGHGFFGTQPFGVNVDMVSDCFALMVSRALSSWFVARRLSVVAPNNDPVLCKVEFSRAPIGVGFPW